MVVIETRSNGTTVIVISFVIIAYGIQPVVQNALYRVRAYRAWRAIERKELVEVTQYPYVSEILHGRGKWDAARIIAVLLGCFSIAAWVLELSLGLANVDRGPVDMMERPPPVYYRDLENGVGDVRTAPWEVRDGFKLGPAIVESAGTLGNFEGTFESGVALSRYRIGEELYKGSILNVWWSDNHLEAHTALAYNVNNTGLAILETLNCTLPQKSAPVYVGDNQVESWGNVRECASGPPTTRAITGSARAIHPPSIILENHATGDAHIIVEEDSNYPSFLYSVWTPIKESVTVNDTMTAASAATSPFTIKHAFHIASKSRLVEAIITGIVNGAETGGECVDLRWQFSEQNAFYPATDSTRASPFGEHPGNSTTTQLSNVEPIEAGVDVNSQAIMCFMWILFVSVVGVGSSIGFRSRIGLDVFDRDELIRAVSLPGHNPDGSPPAPMRMFVQKDDSGCVKVVIDEGGDIPWSMRCWSIVKQNLGACRCLFREDFRNPDTTVADTEQQLQTPAAARTTPAAAGAAVNTPIPTIACNTGGIPSPVRSHARSPAHSQARSQAQSSARSPAQSSLRSQVQSPARSPPRPRRVVLEGWRVGTARAFPRSHGPWEVSLTASPLNSPLSSTPTLASPVHSNGIDPATSQLAKDHLEMSESGASQEVKQETTQQQQQQRRQHRTYGGAFVPEIPVSGPRMAPTTQGIQTVGTWGAAAFASVAAAVTDSQRFRCTDRVTGGDGEHTLTE